MTGASLNEPVDVVWLSRHPHVDARGPWDTTILEDLFAGRLWSPGIEFRHHTAEAMPPGLPGAIVCLPARHHAHDVDWLNAELSRLPWVLLILVGDEEGVFPRRKLRHRSMSTWVQLPRVDDIGDDSVFVFGDGRTPHVSFETTSVDGEPLRHKDINWYFAGQVTNPRRKRAANGLRRLKDRTPGVLLETAGFTQGVDRQEYAETLGRTWVVPCPGGPATVDTFRFFEALEAGCIPLMDADPYWQLLASRTPAPFPIGTAVGEWETVGGIVEHVLKNRVWWSNRWQNWYLAHLRTIVRRLRQDIAWCTGRTLDTPTTTAVITVSPSPTHPSTDMVREVIESARTVAGEQLPILVMADGVRVEQMELHDAYMEHLSELFLMARRLGDVQVIWSPNHVHQAELARMALRWVDSPLLLFLEHDTPLVADEPIDFAGCERAVLGGHMDLLRFHHEALVLPAHEHLMLDASPVPAGDIPVRRTVQWSQRPHLAAVGYYRFLLGAYFSERARCFIEDRMHSFAQSEPDRNRLAIYHPEGNIKRSYHLDGRRGGPKFDETQVW